MIPIVAAVSSKEAGYPIHARISAVSSVHSDAISDWAQRHIIPGSQVLSQWLMLLFYRRYSMDAMTERFAHAVCCCRTATESDLRVAFCFRLWMP